VLRFCSLVSGSSSNATLIEATDGVGVGAAARPTRLLVDCGLSLRQIEQRLRAAGADIAELDAIFITHEHSDHLGSALRLAARASIPVWASQGTWDAALSGTDEALAPLIHIARDQTPIAIGALCVEPFTVPHDTREPLQLRAGDGARRLGILTDLGHATPHAIDMLRGCQALLLESNHDPDLLERSSYPAFLKRRILGPNGHLSNAQSLAVLTQLMHPALTTVVAAHLSERNNQPERVQAGWAPVLGCAPEEVLVASRDGLGWMSV
jgi:phosphoribosyl 1,2-cyclic phosphodiesterase